MIHSAFDHDFSRFVANCEEDRRAIDAMGAVLEGSDRPMLVTSGLGRWRRAGSRPKLIGPSTIPARFRGRGRGRWGRGVRASAVRLPPSTHGRGDHGFVPRLIASPRERCRRLCRRRRNRWPAASHRRRPALPAGDRKGVEIGLSRGRRRGRAVQSDRGGDRRRLRVPVVLDT